MFKRIFEFNRAEKNGILLLIILIVIVIGVHWLLPFMHERRSADLKHEQAYQEFLALVKEKEDASHQTSVTDESYIFDEHDKSLTYFAFDPNTASRDDLQKLGFNRFQINNLQKFLEAGGRIATKNDLLKIYGVDTSFYKSIEPYITIPGRLTDQYEQAGKPDKQDKQEMNPDLQRIDINRAQAAELQSVYGIGPRRSETIIRYRDLLGGYCRISQLHEVYGLPDSVVQQLTKAIIIDSNVVQRISLNQAGFKDLVRHPYISEYHTKSILKFRDMQENINTPEELYENKVIDSVTWAKVKYYLKP